MNHADFTTMNVSVYPRHTYRRYNLQRIGLVLSIIALVLTPFNDTLAEGKLAASIKDFEGEVGVKKPGGDWTPAEAGTSLVAGDFISTGFESWVVLDVPGGAEARLEELTQIKVAKLLSKKGAVKTLLRLRTGGLDAHIKKTPGVKTQFEVNTPTSTLSVRGTQEQITMSDGFGTQVKVIAGSVNVTSASGQSTSASAGDTSTVSSADSAPSSPSDELNSSSISSQANRGHTSGEQNAFNAAGGQQTSNSSEGGITSSSGFQEAMNASLRIVLQITDN